MLGNGDDKSPGIVPGNRKLNSAVSRILAAVRERIVQNLANKNNDGAYDIVKMEVGGAEQRMVISHAEAAQMLLEIQNLFCVYRDFGRASEMVKSAAETLADDGAYLEAAEAYFTFAEELFQQKQYGWAGARYYNAALIFVRRGMLNEARRYLQKAWERFASLPKAKEEYWYSKLREHLTILSEDRSTKEDLVELSQLRFDFMAMSRDNWVKACEEGSQRLMRELRR